MRYTTKTIRRATKESAYEAMKAHIAKMAARGWKVDEMNDFAGDAGLQYERIVSFYKETGVQP